MLDADGRRFHADARQFHAEGFQPDERSGDLVPLQ